MKNIFFNILIIIMLSRCGNTAAPDSSPVGGNVSATPTFESVILTREQLQKADIKLGLPEHRSIASTLTANGTVVVLPQDKATVSSKIGGRIEQFFVHEGQNVQKGQAIMSIASSAIFDLQQTYLQAKADLIFLEKELDRQKILSGQNVGAVKNYEESQSKYARTKGDLQIAVAKLRYLGIGLENLNNPDNLKLAQTVIVTAPISGNITTIPVNLGASVGEGVTLCSIIGLSDLHGHIEVFAKDIALLQVGQPVTIRFPNTVLPTLNTKVEYINRELDPESKTYALHVQLPSTKHNMFLPGMQILADIQTQNGTLGMALPEAAILHDGVESYCFVADDPNAQSIVFQKMILEPILRGGGWVSIPEGLITGKSVVLRGANLVDGALQKGEMEE